MASTSLINGVEYSWSSILVFIGTQTLTGISSINYSETRNITHVYGVGSQPVSRAYGNYEREASMTLHLGEIQSLLDASPNGRLDGIPEFSVVITYQVTGGRVIKHRLVNCRFTNNGVSMSQGDEAVETELTMAVGDIVWNS